MSVRSSMQFYSDTLWNVEQVYDFEDSHLSGFWDRIFFARGLEWSNGIPIVDTIMTLPKDDFGSLEYLQTSHCFLWVDGFDILLDNSVKSARCYS